MKTLILGSLFLAVLVVGCTDDNEKKSVDQPTEIKMNATVASTTLRSGPINNDFSSDFPLGIYAYNPAWKAGSNANLINNDAATVAGVAGHAVTFASGPYYYPSDGTSVSFFAFAPRATEKEAATAGASPVVTFNITGHEDVMWASSSGSKSGSATATHPTLSFAHKLTQLQFKFASGTGYPVSGNTVISLAIKNQPSVVDMIVATGACTFATNTDMFSFTTTTLPAGVEITTAGGTTAPPLMTEAKTATEYQFDIIVKPSGGGSNITYSAIPLTLTTVTGSSHLITFTFTATAVTATATVAAWATGTGGSVTVL